MVNVLELEQTIAKNYFPNEIQAMFVLKQTKVQVNVGISATAHLPLPQPNNSQLITSRGLLLGRGGVGCAVAQILKLIQKNNKNKNKTNNRHGRNKTAEKCSYSAKTVLTISSEDKHAKMSPVIAKTKEISKIYIDIFFGLKSHFP